jgi:hypothetical protein
VLAPALAREVPSERAEAQVLALPEAAGSRASLSCVNEQKNPVISWWGVRFVVIPHLF